MSSSWRDDLPRDRRRPPPPPPPYRPTSILDPIASVDRRLVVASPDVPTSYAAAMDQLQRSQAAHARTAIALGETERRLALWQAVALGAIVTAFVAVVCLAAAALTV